MRDCLFHRLLKYRSYVTIFRFLYSKNQFDQLVCVQLLHSIGTDTSCLFFLNFKRACISRAILKFHHLWLSCFFTILKWKEFPLLSDVLIPGRFDLTIHNARQLFSFLEPIDFFQRVKFLKLINYCSWLHWHFHFFRLFWLFQSSTLTIKVNFDLSFHWIYLSLRRFSLILEGKSFQGFITFKFLTAQDQHPDFEFFNL